MKNQYKILDMDVNELPFADFLTSRYSMTVKLNALKTLKTLRWLMIIQ